MQHEHYKAMLTPTLGGRWQKLLKSLYLDYAVIKYLMKTSHDVVFPMSHPKGSIQLQRSVQKK